MGDEGPATEGATASDEAPVTEDAPATEDTPVAEHPPVTGDVPATEDALAAGEVRVFEFDLATAIVPTGAGFSATIDPGWTIGSRPNGGYLIALATRAALMVTGQPHPLAVSSHFLAPPSTGPGELEVQALRNGRSVSTARATLLQQGQPCLEALVSSGRLEPGAEPAWRADSEPPELPPVDDCLPGQVELPGSGLRVAIVERLDMRLDPATAGWARGKPAGRLEARGWVRFRDGRPPDPLGLLQAVDALPPTSFELGIMTWAPTLELTVYVRDLPSDGWLRCAIRGRLLQGGWFDEEVEVWDERGHLVAQSRQLAGARGGGTPGPIPPPTRAEGGTWAGGG
jgi:acyl-CoA thioesterase